MTSLHRYRKKKAFLIDILLMIYVLFYTRLWKVIEEAERRLSRQRGKMYCVR